jgi:hypothetical protein
MNQEEFVELCKDINFDALFEDNTTRTSISSKSISLHSDWICLNGNTFYKHLQQQDIQDYSKDIVGMCLQYNVHVYIVCRDGVILSYTRMMVDEDDVQLPVVCNLCGIVVSTSPELTQSRILEGILCQTFSVEDDLESDMD